jgi:hypothetical protein
VGKRGGGDFFEAGDEIRERERERRCRIVQKQKRKGTRSSH